MATALESQINLLGEVNVLSLKKSVEQIQSTQVPFLSKDSDSFDVTQSFRATEQYSGGIQARSPESSEQRKSLVPSAQRVGAGRTHIFVDSPRRSLGIDSSSRLDLGPSCSQQTLPYL